MSTDKSNQNQNNILDKQNNEEATMQSVASDMYINDEYFRNAKEWYFQKYLMQYKMRSVFILVSAFICVITGFTIFLLLSEIMMPKSVQGVIQNPISPSVPLRIKKVTGSKNKHSDKAIARFLIEDFITKLEQFDSSVDKQKELDRKNNIFSNGGLQRNMTDVFQNRFNSIYIPSYISSYTRKVKVEGFEYLDEIRGMSDNIKQFLTPSQVGDEAQVIFRVNYEDQDGQVTLSELYLANIRFYFRPIKIMQDGKPSSIKFFIDSYSINRLE